MVLVYILYFPMYLFEISLSTVVFGCRFLEAVAGLVYSLSFLGIVFLTWHLNSNRSFCCELLLYFQLKINKNEILMGLNFFYDNLKSKKSSNIYIDKNVPIKWNALEWDTNSSKKEKYHLLNNLNYYLLYCHGNLKYIFP